MNRHLKKRKLRRFLLSSIDTVIIPRLHFDLAESDRYRDYPWGLVAYEELAKSLNKKLKPTRKFYMLHGMPLAIQIWLYECCSVVPRTITFKVDSEISRLLNWKTNVIRPRYESLMKSLFNDSNDKSPEMSFFNREDEDDVLSKKVFEKFRDEVRKEFNDIRNLVSTTSDQLMNSINEMKKQEKDKDCDKAQMEEDNKNTSPHQSTSTAVEGFNKNSEGILVKDYEFVKPQLDEANKDTSPHESTPILHHDFDKNPEGTLVIEEIKEKQSTNFTELYNADNDVVLDKIDTSVHEERDVCDSTLKTRIGSTLWVLLNSHGQMSRCIYVYDSLSSVGYDFVVLAEVEKLAEVIPYYLLVCKFYEKKGIDNDNHPNYKLNDKHDLFDVYIMEDLTPQPCDSLDCGLYMITYAECFTFDGSVSKVDFDPDLFCTRYTSMLWHYGTRK
ncbi:hypothetical protein FXO38_31992 [Capsicum annuum]|nr:hypothetical protein FXO38_31992 [Capsicum annuum]